MCIRKNMSASSANRREMLGQELFLIRFPILTDNLLLDGPVKSGLLLQSEVLDIYHYKYATIKPQLPFRTEPRQNIRTKGTINFTIPDVRELLKASTFSDPVAVRKLLWCIQVQKEAEGKLAALGFYVRCSGSSASWMCQTTTELRLLPWKTETVPIKRGSWIQVSRRDHCSWGYEKYISVEDLLDPAKGYANPSDFSLRLQAQVTAELPAGIE
ncbi:BTB/POZ domain-containing protein 6-like isoform X2 [Paramacrobiotus metropolitanus]|uniref:BTB/POZ domain-containing protein 6-like isoform X2 n=1 Tax=Paramacrobiotus metropolitanus TaxID=2943436 RepID=UPI0024463D18|nr:BTB/POZ domain-containing protein 6-like isoform X2 [Paramacrobiotus metropolitanus]